jgi:putative CocE/NonD family hydrolase
VRARSLYFQADGQLGWNQPAAGATGFDRYISDPAHPVPYRVRPIYPLYGGKVGSSWPLWLVDDQRLAHLRPDVLSYETGPLDHDVTIAGTIAAKLFVATTGSDADWIVKLIDVYPDDYPADPKMGGYQLMVANDVFRSRFRTSFEKPAAMVPGQVTPITVDLHAADYTFLQGHRIMVQVQSTWFPLIDRNPQKFVPNIFKARDQDYIKAEHRVYRSAQAPSRIDVSVVTP